MDSSRSTLPCGSTCRSLQAHESLSLPRVHIYDEHPARDDECIERSAARLYKRLWEQQCRILKILPGRPRSSLKCRLLRATLTPVDGARLDEGVDQGCLIQYDALSYSWGLPLRTCSVICNGIDVPVTPHLKNALRSLRHRRRENYVWTDALCINQLNDNEKGLQVQLMFTIFRKAQKVIGWLGSSAIRCEYEDLFMYLHLMSTRGFTDFANPYQIKQLYPQGENSTCDRVSADLKLLAVSFVKQDSWFQRTWIRQEVFAAKEVEMRYGPYRFTLQGLIQLIELVDYAYTRPDLQRFHRLVERHSARALSQRSYDKVRSTVAVWLEAALSNAQGFEATKEQDLIFALQNIAQPEHPRCQLLFPKIDYQMSTHEVFEQFIKRLFSLGSGPSLAPISIFEDRTDFQSCGLPSWVPDWRKTKTRLAKTGLDSNHDFAALELGLDPSRPGVLSMNGVLLGTVSDEWAVHEYQSVLSASLGVDNRPYALSHYKMYRSYKSSLSFECPFSEVSSVGSVLEEIAYRPYKYNVEGLTFVDGQRHPYVLASAVVRPRDILVSFGWQSAFWTKAGIERRTPCSVLRKCPSGTDRYYFLGPCVFDTWHKVDESEFRGFQMSTRKYALV